MFFTFVKRFFMKKLFFIAAFLISSSTWAQDFRFGIVGNSGLGWFKPQTKLLQANGANLNFGYGLMGDYNFSENYALNMGFMIGTSGGNLLFDSLRYEIPAGSSNLLNVKSVNYEYKMQWIELPISLKLKTNEIGYMKYFASFGLKPSILTTAKARNLESSYSETADWFYVNKSESDHLDALYKDNIFPVRASLLIQAGAEYNLGGNTSLFGSVYFDKGFSNIMGDKHFSATNAMAGIQVGVFF